MLSIVARRAAAGAAAGRAVRCASSAAAGAADKLPSFARALFQGQILTDAVHPYPNALTAEQAATVGSMVEPVTKFFAETNDAAKNDATGIIPEPVLQGLREMGAYGLQVPESLGGVGLSNSAYARMVEVVGTYDLGVGIHLGASQSIGYKGILLYGNEEQKAKYLPKLASGEHVAAFTLTEPGAGSDAAGVKTRAVLSPDGKHYVLNGSKIWISNGGIAQVYTVFAKMEVTDPATGEKRDKMGAFIVERGYPGLSHGPPEKKMGINCSNTAEVYLDNVKVPVENLLGKPGDGFKIAMGILNNGRFGMGAALTGTMKGLIERVAAHASQRVQFGRKLREFGVIRAKVAAMEARVYAVESLAYLVAANMDRGATDFQIEAAISKVVASEGVWFVADEAIQIAGGLGFMKALPYERIMRDARIFRIFEGANEILRQMIGLTGLQSAGKALEPVTAASKAPLTNLGTLAPFALRLAKARVGMYDAVSLPWAAPPLRSSAEVVEQATAQFGVAVTQLLMAHGKKIVEQQLLVERVADVVIDLTVSMAVLARASKAHAAGTPTAAHEVALATLYVGEAKARMASNMRGFTGGQSKLDKLRMAVSDEVFAGGTYLPTHPLGV
jgi:very long chain acyl-CoA dehydrogenase